MFNYIPYNYDVHRNTNFALVIEQVSNYFNVQVIFNCYYFNSCITVPFELT